MKNVLLSTSERYSPRWNRLCELLGAATPGERYQTMGHLWVWYQTWASQPELEAGVWFQSVGLQELGRWADVSAETACKWGRSLLAAGYLANVKDVYPEPLASARKGYVALDMDGVAMLDAVFPLVHRRPNALVLVAYVMDREIRARWARILRADGAAEEAAGRVPAGWFVSAGGGEGAAHERGAHGVAARGEASRRVVGFCPGDEAREPRRAIAPAPAKEFDRSGVLMIVREYKYSDPLRALGAIDGRENAMKVWRTAVARDREKVCAELGDIVSTDAQWYACRNPGAVITANLRRAGVLGRRDGG